MMLIGRMLIKTIEIQPEAKELAGVTRQIVNAQSASIKVHFFYAKYLFWSAQNKERLL